ncbi:MAG: FKBP-type peptidyl-prolyl cis-trans isomerase [Saprospiraceae bacterium]|nr:FKBP-type peptidyl-prolyl cis-trans isomerase [Saprospiraceae bacterium]
MKKLFLIPMVFFQFLFGLNVSYAQELETDTTKTETEKPKSATTIIKEFSYSYGYSFAKDLKEKTPFGASELVEKEVLKGMQDALKPDPDKLAITNSYIQDRIKRDSVAKTTAEGAKTAYHLGYSALANIIITLEIPSSDFNFGSIKKGFSDFYKGKTPVFTDEEMTSKLNSYFQVKQIAIQKKLLAKRKEEGKKNLALAVKYLEENAKKDGVKTTDSGLQYQVIKEGSGPKAKLENTVVTHYTGTFLDGKIFDSSIERGKPATFLLNNVIQGWQEGIQLMSAGARYRLFVHPELAYGEEGPATIPPNSLLIFDVELMEIQKGEIIDSTKSKLSYSYGFMIGQSLEKLNLTLKERDPNYFIQGFVKGFEASDEDIKTIEDLLNSRIESGKESIDEAAAQKIAFGLGFSSSAGISRQLGIVASDFVYNDMGLGFSNYINGEKAIFTDEEMSNALKTFFEPIQKKIQAEMMAKDNEIAKTNNTLGENFMNENAKKDGVQTMKNGMQYIILKESEGEKPTINDKVTTHYKGTLIDGTVFDSSIDRGEPATFPLGSVIQGWQEGIPLMSVGSKYKFFIPSNLAYGNKSVGKVIPAGSTLIFEVELLKIN